MRFFLQYLLPFLLPALAYVAWVMLTRNHRADGVAARLQMGPWFWLILIGFALMVGGLVATALLRGSDPGGTYIPPRYEDGVVVPGRIE